MTEARPDTRDADYTRRLSSLEGASWKRWFDVQAPYRWNLRRLKLGFTLDVGCGIGRNLVNLDGKGVGVDHNPHSVARARERGCTAFDLESFGASEHARPGGFDSMLVSHVLEHMELEAAAEVVRSYLDYVKTGGRIVLITPQEAGFASDATHVQFMDFEALETTLRSAGVEPERRYSFPFPRVCGRVFVHNEFVVVGRKR